MNLRFGQIQFIESLAPDESKAHGFDFFWGRIQFIESSTAITRAPSGARGPPTRTELSHP
jgi:hypothetical protein